jgi:hypothetical protein
MRPLLSRSLLVCGLLTALSGLSGCLMAGNYHSARTLEKGTSSFGMNFSMTTYQVGDDRVTLPNLIPEVTYHIGVSDDVELGGRVALGSLGGEFDAKIRFVKGEKLHMAIAPAIAYQAAIFIEAFTFRLPAILTFDMAENASLNFAVFGVGTKYGTINESEDADWANFRGTQLGLGASLGIELRGEVFLFRPAVEFTQWQANLSDSDGTTEFDPYNTVNVVLHIAFIGGREKKQLDRIENKLDNMNGGGAPQ